MLYQYPPTHLQTPFAAALPLPPLIPMRQTFSRDGLPCPEEAVRSQLSDLLSHRRLDGQRIAITVGSRGIPRLQKLVRAMGEVLRGRGAEPFVVPCMGSHGGASAEGQAEVLAGFGVTEEAVNMLVRSSMDTVAYAQIGDLTLYCDRLAAQADGIVVCNKVRPHTMFHGAYESGLAKMMAVGLGKYQGAAAFHALGFRRFPEFLPQAEARFLARFPVLCGVAVLQNEWDEIFHVEALPPETMAQREPELLQMARARMARFPLPEVDLLILDQVGKNISGSGFDPNIFARSGDPLHQDHAATRFQRLYVRTLSKESGHMGTGAFFSDFLSRQTVSDVDWSATWTNCVTCGLSAARGIPIYLNSDREALQAALQTLSPRRPEELRILWAKNSLELSCFHVSRPLYEALRGMAGIEPAGEFQLPRFDGEGGLCSVYERAPEQSGVE